MQNARDPSGNPGEANLSEGAPALKIAGILPQMNAGSQPQMNAGILPALKIAAPTTFRMHF